ncbi:LAME_0D03972g1_1 [Lachancea meyersii CBS 8951]|uniref:LAME_0D03972g1_1 n=1 Tax=Lachancea meyersii CBS 8951 TaxID=1266667 RepID=A0A1G4J7W0_9SACH|nr:LAME_0D03972g1_1 [Lachancea meyersii CBS 8951]
MQKISELFRYNVTQFLMDAVPRFSKSSDKAVRRALTQKAGVVAICISALAVCILLPLWNYLALKRWAFKLRHYLRHDVLRKLHWFRGSRVFHSQSFRICLFWFLLSSICSLAGARGDLIQITKRLGRVAVALMPPLLFLTLRPSPLPHTLYLSLLPIHKWISRIVVLLSTLHTLLYSWYFVRHKTFFAKISKPANLWGAIALLLFAFIAVSSLSQIRRFNFQLFYYTHYLATWMTVFLIHFHARPPVPYYTAMSCSLLVGQIAYRVFRTTKVLVCVNQISPNLVLVDFPMSKLAKRPTMPSAHIRMAPYHRFSPLRRILQQCAPLQHPYTIASLPNDDNVKLIVRSGKFKLRNNSQYLLTGPFEPKLDFLSKSKRVQLTANNFPFQNQSPALLASPLHYNIDARRALIITGGSAISFGLPLLRILNFNGVTVRLKWVTRDYRDLRLLNHFKNNFEGLEIYITGDETDEQDLRIDYVDFNDEPSDTSDSSSQTKSGSQQSDQVSSPSNNYGTFRSTGSSDASIMQNQGRSNQEDEIDFTQMFSARSTKTKNTQSTRSASTQFHKEDAFRKPSIVVPPPSQSDSSQDANEASLKSLKIPAGVKVYFGRPNLTNHDYQWCLERECIGPSDTNDCCQPSESKAHVDDLCRVRVIAAGPSQLVENTKRWANDGGLHFHEESFTL